MRDIIVRYRVGDELLNSRELIQRYHPNGDEVLSRVVNWKKLGLKSNPGFAQEKDEAILLSGAMVVVVEV